MAERPSFASSVVELPGSDLLTDEERVTVLLSRLDPPAAVLESAAIVSSASTFDWMRVVECATRLWVHPLVAGNALGPPIAATLPDAARRAWLLAQLAGRVRWSAYQRLLAPVVDQWADDGIEVTLLKGAGLAATLYPEGSRLVNDLDLRVPTERLDEASTALERHGLVRDDPPGEDPNGRTFVVPGPADRTPLVVDLHGDLESAASPFELTAGRWAQRGIAADFAGTPVRVFRREDQFVHLASQLARDVVIKLHRVTDLVALVESGAAALEWPRLRASAIEAKACGAVALGLRWAAAAGATIPHDWIAEMEALHPDSRASNDILLDARALLPRFRLRAAAHPILGGGYASPDDRRSMIAAFPGKVWRRQRASGVPLVRAVWKSVESPLALAASVAAIRLAARLRELDAPAPVDGIRDLLWVERGPQVRRHTGPTATRSARAAP